MELYTQQEVMDFWDEHASDEDKAETAEIKALEKDIETARKYLRDALARYRKDKTRSRSKAKAEDPFEELNLYSSKDDIQEAFGWEFISEAERDRLWHLWDLREESKNKKVLEDRVTEILERAIVGASTPYDERIYQYSIKRREMKAAAREVAKANFERR